MLQFFIPTFLLSYSKVIFLLVRISFFISNFAKPLCTALNS